MTHLFSKQILWSWFCWRKRIREANYTCWTVPKCCLSFVSAPWVLMKQKECYYMVQYNVILVLCQCLCLYLNVLRWPNETWFTLGTSRTW